MLAQCAPSGDRGPSSPAAELASEAIANVVGIYRQALMAEDIDRLQGVLSVMRGAAQRRDHAESAVWMEAAAFRDTWAEAFRLLTLTDLELSRIEVANDWRSVTFREAASVLDPATAAQHTRIYRTTSRMSSEVDGDGATTFRIAKARRDGPLYQVTTLGRVVSAAITRVEVMAETEPSAIDRIDISAPSPSAASGGEACEVEPQDAVPLERIATTARFQGLFTALQPEQSAIQTLCVRIHPGPGEVVVIRHRYRLRRLGDGVVQKLPEVRASNLFAVAVAPDGSVWFGGEETGAGMIGRAIHVNSEGQLENEGRDNFVARLTDVTVPTVGRFADLVIDALGRLHFPFLLEARGGGIVANGVGIHDPDHPDRFCQTVNVFNDDYPFVEHNTETGERRRSASVRAIAAGGGDIWLFGSSAGVARVADDFRDGQCPKNDVDVRYAPIFRQADNGLLSNIVTSMVDGADGALWFGTLIGLNRLQDGAFTALRFNREGRNIAALETAIREQSEQDVDPASDAPDDRVLTLEAFFRQLAQAIFESQPLATTGIGDVSFEEIFGGPVVKEDLIFSAVEDAQGRLWVGTLGGGIRRLEGDRQTLHLRRRDGLGSNGILALAAGRYPDKTVWAVTDEGVSRIDDAGGSAVITNFSALDGLDAAVRDITVDAAGTAWLATDAGAFRIVPEGRRISGVVLDTQSLGHPVVGADINAEIILDTGGTRPGTPFRAVTDDTGRFVFDDLPAAFNLLRVQGPFAVGGPYTEALRDVDTIDEAQPPIVIAPGAFTCWGRVPSGIAPRRGH